MGNIPLGVPGASANKSPFSPNDKASHVRRAFSYQDYAAFTLACLSLLEREYVELWLEHHDDIIAVRQDGTYDVFQVKTCEQEGRKWKANDREIAKAFGKFARMEQLHGNAIKRYFIYSNISPYTPAEHAEDERLRAESLEVLKQSISLTDSPSSDSDPISRSFHQLLKSSGVNEAEGRAVLQKMYFKVGAALGRFQSDAHNNLPSIDSRLANWSISDLNSLEQLLVTKIVYASSANVPPLISEASTLSASGVSHAEIEHRCVSICALRQIIDSQITRRKRRRQILALVGAGVFIVALALLRPVVGHSALQEALDTVKSARGSVLPATFKESIAMIRAAGTPLMDIDLTAANLACQDLSSLDLRRMNAPNLRGSGVIFNKSLLSMAVLNNSELNTSKFIHARMDHIFLEHANLIATLMYSADARFANLHEATLQAANLARADLSGADLRGANMMLAELREANFEGADLNGSDLSDADVSGADLLKARNLTQKMMNKTCNAIKHPPKLSKPLKASNRPCYVTEEQRMERMVKRLMLAFVGMQVPTNGFCSKGRVEYRPTDSKRHPEDNEKMFLDFSEVDDPPEESSAR